MSSKAGWEEEARNWAAWARAPRHDSYYQFRRAFFDDLLPPPGRATLELGCGEGRVARDLRDHGHRVTAIDASPTLLVLAREADPDGTYALADAADLPLEDGSFDLVVAYNSLMDFDDLPGAVREAARVLEPGGRFAICITHPVVDAGRWESRDPAAPFVISGSYFGRRPYGETFSRGGLTMTFHGYVASLEHYARELEDARFLIERLREPAIPEAEVAADPGEERWLRLPNFLHILAIKP
ncbi:MAG: class I SAM-dependent methyltransferase [Gaiellaceae bacterium]